MKLLAIETSTRNLSLALAGEGGVIREYRGDAVLRHSQDLVPNLRILLREAATELADISCFAISIGPGSFTGLRVGAAMVKGLNFVTKIPIAAVPTLDVIADKLKDSGGYIGVLIDARKNNLYAALYRAGNGDIIRVSGYELVRAEDLKDTIRTQRHRGTGTQRHEDAGIQREKLIFTGDGIGPYKDLITGQFPHAEFADEKDWYPDVKIVARLGLEKYKKGRFADPDTLTPMYIYSSECQIKGVEK